jgi:hypothetical protein
MAYLDVFADACVKDAGVTCCIRRQWDGRKNEQFDRIRHSWAKRYS